MCHPINVLIVKGFEWNWKSRVTLHFCFLQNQVLWKVHLAWWQKSWSPFLFYLFSCLYVTRSVKSPWLPSLSSWAVLAEQHCGTLWPTCRTLTKPQKDVHPCHASICHHSMISLSPTVTELYLRLKYICSLCLIQIEETFFLFKQ